MSGLSNEQAAATLDYLVFSGARVSQMTKTYSDLEAVTRLLGEKEKDLELAAKIGQELLERNRFLDERVAQLEAQAASAADLITQLRHELQQKGDLLRVYTRVTGDEDELEIKSVNVDLLEKKIQELQCDNRKLHEEATEVNYFGSL